MRRLFRTELYKLIHSRSFWITAGSALLLSTLMLMDSRKILGNIFLASLYNTPLLYFLTGIFSAFFIGSDFTERTLYHYICAGYQRGQILLAKILICQAACTGILSLPLWIHKAVGSCFFSEDFFQFPHPGLLCGFLLLSMTAMDMLPLFLAFVFRDVGKTLAVTITAFFLMVFWMNSGQAQRFAVLLPMGQIRLLSLGSLPVSVFTAGAIDVFWILIFYLGAALAFCRSDFK